MTVETQEKIKERSYECCPICSKLQPLRRTRKKGIVNRESGHRRIVVEIENGKTFAIPFHYEKNRIKRNNRA